MGKISLLLLCVKSLPSKRHDMEELSGKDGGPRCQSKNWKSFIVGYSLPCMTESYVYHKMSLPSIITCGISLVSSLVRTPVHRFVS